MKTASYVLVAIVAMTAGWIARGASASETAATAPVASPRVAATVVGPRCDGITIDQMRTLLADERKHVSAPAEVTVVAVAQPTPPAPPTAPPAASLEHIAAIETVVASGVWTDQARDLLRSSLGELSADQRGALMSEIAVAVNNQTLKVNGPIF
jgi:hypothetical protein